MLNAVAVASVYPLALSLSAAFDTWFGPGAFWDEVSYGSRWRLFMQLLQDWLSSAIWWLPVSLLVLTCVSTRWARGCVFFSIGIGLIVLSVALAIEAVPIFLAATIGFAFIMPALANLRQN
jgi:hypothetical protein